LGFSLLETLIATGLTLTVTGGVFAVLNPSQGSFSSELEKADMQQRLRVGADALARDLSIAGVGALTGRQPGALINYFAPVLPYRAGATGGDPPGTFRSDCITIFYVPTGGDQARSHTYYRKADAANQLYQLMQYDGTDDPDDPVLDHVVGLSFDYYGESVSLTAAELTDGPWRPDDTDANRWDADLLRIRTIGVTLRIEAAAAAMRGPAGLLFANGGISRGGGRWLPDQVITFQIAPRNLNLAR